MEYTYKYREDCWFRGKCPREAKIGCNSECNIQPEFDYLLNTSNIPNEFKKSVLLYPENCDLEAFHTLKDIQLDVENFVKNGRILYIWSSNVGTGKTTYAVKILKTYLAIICNGNGFKDRAWFEYAPSFILMAKTFESDERLFHIDALSKREFAILDDIGAVKQSDYDTTVLSSIIDTRYSRGLSTIYTSNLSPHDLEKTVGVRLSDRILSDVVVSFVGAGRRQSTNTYERR